MIDDIVCLNSWGHCKHATMNCVWVSLKQFMSVILSQLLYIPRNMHTVFALLCFVVVIHWLIFPYRSGLLHWHCGNLTIAQVPAKQPWWIWINTSCEFIMNDCITTTKQSTTKPCAYFLGYTVWWLPQRQHLGLGEKEGFVTHLCVTRKMRAIFQDIYLRHLLTGFQRWVEIIKTDFRSFF